MRKGIKKYSPGIGKKSKNKNKGSLQAACEKTRRVSLCSFRAVLTVEAAFVVPLFLLAICTLLGMIDLYRVQALVRTSLHQSAQELGMYASVESGDSGVCTPVGVLSTGICIAYAKSHLPEKRPRSESYPDYCGRLQGKSGSMVSGQKRRLAS